jgi:putative ABC transport system substrate-binding protein
MTGAKMRRREFLTALGGLALSWPVEAYGQKPRIPRIGYLFSFTEHEGQQLWDACCEGLQELGYIAGQNITLEPRWAEGRHDRLPALANDNCPQHANAADKLLTKLDDAYGW